MLSPNKIIAGRSAADWISSCPVVGDICELMETAWLNPDKQPFEQAKAACPLGMADIEDAAARLERFAPYLCRVFPETAESHGIIESAVRPIPAMQKVLEETSDTAIAGQVWIKLDSHLPISGSIKARGGIYEVLKTAEDIALQSGMLHLTDDYAVLDTEPFREAVLPLLHRCRLHRQPRPLHRHHERKTRLQSHRPHVCGRAAVEKRPPAQPRSQGGGVQVRLQHRRGRGPQAGRR